VRSFGKKSPSAQSTGASGPEHMGVGDARVCTAFMGAAGTACHVK
jgi:hypothetical protein